MAASTKHDEDWPELPYSAWKDTCETLHLWTQAVGKIRLALTPWLNHSWHVPLYVNARGLTTSPIYYGRRAFEIVFDFQNHFLEIETAGKGRHGFALEPRTVAEFYEALQSELRAAGIEVRINEHPCEIPAAIPFSQDRVHASYDPGYAQRFWKALLQADRVFKQFRTGFIGKCSPVHFFWGSFDLAVTRFSGRRAPQHPGGIPGLPDEVVREAYSHEVSSAGFWPGGAGIDYAAFYSYTYPRPDGFGTFKAAPDEAFFSEALGEFLLPYGAVRAATDPDAALLVFLNTTYEAAARAGKWERAALERKPGIPGVPTPPH
ncbi:MAG: DUF5996 family protein [Rhodomicrobium sp.]